MRLRGAMLCATLAALAGPTPLAAQDAAGTGFAGATVSAWVASAVALILLLAAVHFKRRLTAAESEAAALRDELDRERAVTDTVPQAVVCWDPVSGDRKVSELAAHILGVAVDAPVGAAEFAALAKPEMRGEVEDAVRALLDRGRSFDLTLSGAGGRRFAAAGRSVPLQGEAHLSVVWLRDDTEAARETAAAERRGDSFRKILDAFPFPVWRRNADAGLEYANAAYLESVEVSPGTPARDVPELAAGAVRDNGRAMARRAFEEQETQVESHHIVAAGERRLLELTETPIPGENGTAGFAIDRTELEDLKTTLERHIASHEDVLHTLGTAIAIYGPDQRLDFYNHAFLQLWQLDEQFVNSRPTLSLVLETLRDNRRIPEQANFPDFKAQTLAFFTSLIERQEELSHLPDGKTLRAVVAPHPFGGLLMTWEDVTATLALERSYNTLIAVQRETLDNLYEGIAVIGGDGRLRLSNPAFGRIWQIEEDELSSAPHISQLVEHMREFLDVDDWDARCPELISLLTGRESQSGRLERANGSVVDFATVPLPDGAVLLSYVDVSDSHRVEQFLRERNEALETADRLKSEFIANVSYELRTPLNTIIGFAEILSGEYFGDLNERQSEYSRGILESSQRLLSLINDILDLATIESGHMSLELEAVDLHDLLGSVLGLTRERVTRKNLKLVFDCPEDIGTILVDDRRLKQALFNILSNSVKFTPEEGEVTVSARRVEDQVVITFTDTGIGIPAEDHERIFRRFERGNNPQARRSGAGLGLSLVKSFIELHGGSVELESEPDVGTKVVCSLPARKAQGALPRAANSA